mmetsp:Transcript_5492/g.8104  ORF Transcript_5492/g.8104 Transcript_5492/m.8104 type:complete len:785 (+) Transcript_5492:1386-3740(+)
MGRVKLYCDNQSALDNVFDSTPKRGIYPMLAVDYDLLVLSRDMLKALPITITGEWVKGHYKGDNRQIQHDLNDLVDTLANQFREDPAKGYEPTAKPMYHPSHEVAVYIAGSMITSKLQRIMYERRFQGKLIQTIQKRAKWTNVEFESIDWDIFGKVFNSYSRFHQTSVAKFVHGLWNTGEQKILFKQDAEGLCPCCNSTKETTAHIFKCTAPAMVTHRNQQLQQFVVYLDQQELPKPVRQCIYAGMTGWIDSALDKPSLIAPTRGKVTPAEQMATKAFTDQTAVGWDAWFRGHFCLSWRKAILFSNPKRDDDATETHLRRLMKKLHSFSLAVWECRNGILHGDTREKRRTIRTLLIRDKVIECFELYMEGKIVLLARDNYLFAKKSLEQRLKGDDDMLLSWLRIVEVAMQAYERKQDKEAKNALVFFQKFRALGRQKLLVNRSVAATMQQEGNFDTTQGGRFDTTVEGCHRDREENQLAQDVSEQTQRQYRTRRQTEALEGLSDTMLSITFDDGVSQTPPETEEDSIVGPGPFYVAPIVDCEFSSDSSYVQSRRRDVAHSYDTFTSSEDTTVTPEGYRDERRQQQLVRMDALIQDMEMLNQLSTQEEECRLWATGTTTESDANEPRRQGNRLAVSSSSDTISNETRRSDAGSRNLGNSTQGSSSFEQLLRFPISRIVEANDVRPQTVTQRLSEEVKNDSSGTESTMGGLSHWTNSPVGGKPFPPARIYIEEVLPEVGAKTPLDILRHEQYYIPLAQGTPGSEVDTVVEESVDTLTDFREWIAGR